MNMFYTQEDYRACTKFHKSNCSIIDKCMLQFVRVAMLVPLTFLFFASVAINKSFMYFLYYESFWGLLLTYASLYLSLASAKNL